MMSSVIDQAHPFDAAACSPALQVATAADNTLDLIVIPPAPARPTTALLRGLLVEADVATRSAATQHDDLHQRLDGRCCQIEMLSAMMAKHTEQCTT